MHANRLMPNVYRKKLLAFTIHIEQSGMRQAAYSGMHNVNPGILSQNQTDRVMRDPWNTLKSPEWGRKRKLPPRQA